VAAVPSGLSLTPLSIFKKYRYYILSAGDLPLQEIHVYYHIVHAFSCAIMIQRLLLNEKCRARGKYSRDTSYAKTIFGPSDVVNIFVSRVFYKIKYSAHK
jgi:hypothetical protein